jgi:hypothetical protein
MQRPYLVVLQDLEDTVMTVPTSGFSPRMGLALAVGMAGLVLAAGVTATTLLGWLGPAKATAVAAESSSPPAPLGGAADPAMSTPHVVLVPVTPAGPAVASGVSAAPVDAALARPLERAFRELEREHGNRAETRRHADDD